jgi:hypothetical protein
MFTVEGARAPHRRSALPGRLTASSAQRQIAPAYLRFGDQREAGRGRQILQHQHRFPDCGEMAVALDDAVPRRTAKLGRAFSIAPAPPRPRADFGDRSSRPRPAGDPPCDRALHFVIAGRDDIDEIGIDQER